MPGKNPIQTSLEKKVDTLGVKVTQVQKKVDGLDISLTKLAVDFYSFKEHATGKLETLDTISAKIDSIENNIDWLVGAFKKFDEEHSF